jgi:hypothetical protein
VGTNVEGNDERLLGAHVKSSHASTKVHGRYCSAEARCALIESKAISLVVVVVRQPLKKVSTPSHLLVRVQPHDNSPFVPYLTPHLGTGHPYTRTSSVLYFLIRYLNSKVGNERGLKVKAVISKPIRSKRYYIDNRRRSLTSL